MGDVMNDFPIIVDAPISREEALQRMTRAHVRHLVVRDQGAYRVVALRDMLASVASQTASGRGRPPSMPESDEPRR